MADFSRSDAEIEKSRLRIQLINESTSLAECNNYPEAELHDIRIRQLPDSLPISVLLYWFLLQVVFRPLLLSTPFTFALQFRGDFTVQSCGGRNMR